MGSDGRTIVFVSGCYDIIHGGHVEFWEQAKAAGGPNSYLVVSFASDAVLASKQHLQAHKLELLIFITWIALGIDLAGHRHAAETECRCDNVLLQVTSKAAGLASLRNTKRD